MININARSIITALIPEHLRERTYVAGSAATPDNRKYSDVDLWVLEPTLPRNDSRVDAHVQERDNHPTVRAILDHFGYDEPNMPFPYQIEPATHLSRVCKVKNHVTEDGMKTVQIMVVSEERIEDLLSKFDISTHMWAIDYYNRDWHGNAATWLHQQPRVTRFTTPHSTLRRYISICERYGHKVNWDDVNHLSRVIAGVEHVR